VKTYSLNLDVYGNNFRSRPHLIVCRDILRQYFYIPLRCERIWITVAPEQFASAEPIATSPHLRSIKIRGWFEYLCFDAWFELRKHSAPDCTVWMKVEYEVTR